MTTDLSDEALSQLVVAIEVRVNDQGPCDINKAEFIDEHLRSVRDAAREQALLDAEASTCGYCAQGIPACARGDRQGWHHMVPGPTYSREEPCTRGSFMHLRGK